MIGLLSHDDEFVLTGELLHPDEIVNVNKKNSWDIERILGYKADDVLLLVVDRKNNKLVTVIERGKEVPNPLFDGVEKYYNMAKVLNVDGALYNFPNWERGGFRVLIVFAIILYALFEILRSI